MADVGVCGDGRGVSTVVGYVLNIGIALLLVTGLLIAASGYVADQRERAVRTELQVVGDRFVSDLSTADRLATVGDGRYVAVHATLPPRAVGRHYTVHVGDVGSPGGEVYVRLVAPQADVTVERTVHLDTAVTNTTRSGGSLRIVVDGGTMEVQDG
ncbi:DUF7266 family protein [Halarchaeum sp. P4]|uniref:DUF7266 family protein n=1 Tax=Halarchaeum sp. P4 TaxID=3421639 RepID=UPI003EB7AE90